MNIPQPWPGGGWGRGRWAARSEPGPKATPQSHHPQATPQSHPSKPSPSTACPTREGFAALEGSEMHLGLCPGRALLLFPPPCSPPSPLIPGVPGEGVHQGGQKDRGPALMRNLLLRESKEEQCLGLCCPKDPKAMARRNPINGQPRTFHL